MPLYDVTFWHTTVDTQRINNASKHRERDKHVTPAAYQKSLIKYYRQGEYIKFPIIHCVEAKNIFFNFMIFWSKITFKNGMRLLRDCNRFFSITFFFQKLKKYHLKRFGIHELCDE